MGYNGKAKGWGSGGGKGRGSASKSPRGGRGNADSNDPYTVKPGETKAYAVKPDAHLSKEGLRHIIGVDGPFFLNGAANEDEYLSAAGIAATRSITNSEALNRLGHFISFFATTVDHGVDCMEGCFDVPEDGGLDPEKLAETGIPQLGATFGSQGGPEFLRAMKYLNVKENMKRNKEETKDMITNMLQFLGANAEDIHTHARSMVQVTSRLYLTGIALLEFTSLLQDLDKWADGITRECHPAAVGKWKNTPKDFDKMTNAFVASFEDRLSVEQNGGYGSNSKQAPRKRYSNKNHEASEAESDAEEEVEETSSWVSRKAKKAGNSNKAKSSSWVGEKPKPAMKAKAKGKGKVASAQAAADPAAASLMDLLTDDAGDGEDEKPEEHLIGGLDLAQTHLLCEQLGIMKDADEPVILEDLQQFLISIPTSFLQHAGVQDVVQQMLKRSRIPGVVPMQQLYSLLLDKFNMALQEHSVAYDVD